MSLADRLKELGEDKGRGWQRRLAQACGVKAPSVSDWVSGRTKTLEADNLLNAASFFEVHPKWLATGIGPKHLAPGESAETALATVETPYLPGFEKVSVPVLATSASMGPGSEQHDDVVVGRLTLSPEWILKTLKPTALENLRFIHGYGDSMEGTFNDGDILLVDGGIVDANIDGVYVLEANNRIFVKRVTERFDGRHEISSDNPKVKTVQLLDGSEPVHILGRVIWAWNGKKL
jgi:phage repressor protein C with HTH and peptisase S24 domain